MKLADISVRNPVFAVMLGAALILLGAFSYGSLGLDLMPNTDPAVVTVTVALPGASAEEVESQLTRPIEEVVNTISGIDELRATSEQGTARITINFTLERDIDTAAQDVREKIATITGRFPRDARPPIIQKVDPDAQPVLGVAIQGPRSPTELTEIADRQVKQALETVADVGSVSFFADRQREIQLLLNPNRLNAYGLTVDQVRQAIQKQNVEVPGGSFVAGPAEIAVRTMGRIQRVEDFNRIIIAYREGSAITLADVGRVQDSVQEVRSALRNKGVPAIGLQIRKQSGTNTVHVVDRVKARIEQIKTTLPPDLEVVYGTDQSRFIRRSFEDIRLHLLLGGLLASVVVWLFIRNLKVTLIAALAIPISIIGTFTVMKALGFTLNNMTLLALSLATGIVIDDAIVVLENIFRFVEEQGISPRAAAAEATAEIGMAVLATTLSLVVIFVPVAFMTGQIGRYFYSFGITSACAILISMLVSFTITPALCATWLKPEDTTADTVKTKGRGVYAAVATTAYGGMLQWALSHRVVMLAVAAAVGASAVILYPRIGKELVPDDDQSEFNISVRLPRGTSYPRTEEFIRPIENEIGTLPDIDTIRTVVSAGSVSFSVGMVPLESRRMSQQDLMRSARAMLAKYQGVRISVSGGTDISGASARGNSSSSASGGPGGSNRLVVLLQGPDLTELQRYTVQLMDKIRTVSGVVDVDSNFETTQPELRVEIDRVRAADLGASIDTLATSLRTFVGGEEISQYQENDKQYPVMLRLDESFRTTAVLRDLLIPAGPGKTVKVSDVARIESGNGPASIERYNRQRQISVVANTDRVPLGQVLAAAREKVDELGLKPGYAAVFGGSARTFNEASNNFMVAMVLAVAFIYMVLASQFNSYGHPLTIMAALPLSLPAGLLALMAFGMTLNVYSAIGLMMLFGIVKKNSILQVDYTNTLRNQGVPRDEAIIRANHVRLRPILMTTIAIVAGMLPIAFGRGAGAGSRATMAVTILGGQILCLLLTLLVTPVVYVCFDDLRGWRPRWLMAITRPGHADRQPRRLF